jgi:hypothetical protein
MIYETYNYSFSSLLTEVFEATDIAQLKKELATPEILPCSFDVTIPGWLERIKLWGKITIKHEDPENHRGARKVTIAKFLDKISNEELTRMLGKWHIDKTGLTSVEFVRDYHDSSGSYRTEKFLIDVKLKRSLR